MQEERALEFYERLTEGTNYTEEITLEHNSGSALTGVKMSPVSKRQLASVIQRLPNEMFEAVEGNDPEQAEEELEEGVGMAAVTEGSVDAFEDLCKWSLSHPELTKPQMQQIIDNLSFEVLFEVGTEIINISVERTGAIKGFRTQG